ncbi:hypothetical protein MHPYR_430058 [uncultured Mycobacterium sp.]|uniref:Uncharacterized protein n=1 Tax=uncultured Mycobacterium sp. TaxID=171292 RepID=A0A1Y5PJH8_9MYCO|nr:hypothetical protein MHPYR_430058 [uncultured Mycobacterium sp.]
MPRSRCWRTYSPAALSGLTRDAALAVLAHLLAGRAMSYCGRTADSAQLRAWLIISHSVATSTSVAAAIPVLIFVIVIRSLS